MKRVSDVPPKQVLCTSKATHKLGLCCVLLRRDQSDEGLRESLADVEVVS